MTNLTEAAGRTWDVIVVGAGPAGALAARQIALQGAAVLLVDRASFPRWKVCGCCLNASALSTLASVSLGNLTANLGAVPLKRLLLAARGCRAEVALPGGVSLSREAFDAALIEAAVASGVQFFSETNATLGMANLEHREVVLTQAGRQVAVQARLVLAADGLGGKLLARQDDFSAVAAKNSRIGAGVVLQKVPEFIEPGSVLMACSAGGYVGLVRLEDGRLDVAAAFDRQTVVAAGGPGPAASNIIAEVGWPVIEGLAEMPWRGTAALTRQASRLSCDRVLVLGDAAGYVEPFTGEGIAWALASAVAIAPLALRAAERWDAKIGKEWSDKYHNIVTNRQSTCRLVARVLRYPVLVRLAIQLLRYKPSLAQSIMRRLNAPSTSQGNPL
ncbi:MAG: FAD-dependent monooxygenase [Bythopirellula sp.]|nr:FAD-dependent monooxygenase [Bythopirellula sp.]